MKVSIICPLWGYFGGRENYLIETAEEIVRRGHTCFIIFEKETERQVVSGLATKIERYRIPGLTSLTTKQDGSYARKLGSILDKEKPDVVFSNDIKNILLLRVLKERGKLVAMTHYGWLFCLRNVRILYFSKNACYKKLGIGCMFHGCFVRKAEGLNKIKYRYNSQKKLRRLIDVYRGLDRHLVASQYMKDLYLQHGFLDQQVEILKLFAETQKARNDAAQNDRPNILFLGRVDRYKGADFLLKALVKLRSSYVCDIIGEGPRLSFCRGLSRRYNLDYSVNFPGWLPKQQVWEYLQKARVVVVPSLMPEAFGLVGIEAMAFGKPVVAFENGGIRDWLKNGETGYLVRAKDVSALAEKIELLLSNPKHAAELGMNGRKMVERCFNKAYHYDRLIQIFEEASNNGAI